MISDAILKQSVYAVIRKYLNINAVIIWDNQAEARPAKPYASLNFISGPVKIGHDIERVSSDDKIEVAGVREFTLSINYFGSKALEELSKLQTSFGFPTAREMLLVNSVVFVSETPPKDLTSLQENRFETRAQMDVRFRVNGSAKDLDRSTVLKVILENDIENSSTTLTRP